MGSRLSRASAIALGVAAVILMAVGTQVAAAATCGDSWTNAAGGSWSTGSNWSLGSAPSSSQSACITIALSGPVTVSVAATADGLTLGAAGADDELEFQSDSSLALGAGSQVADGSAVVLAGGTSAIDVASGQTLTNDGTITVQSGFTNLTGELINAADGALFVTAGTGLTVESSSELLNDGLVSLEGTYSELNAPSGETGASIDNAGGTIEDDAPVGFGGITVGSGSTFTEGGGTIVGSPAYIDGGALKLSGTGASEFLLQSNPSLSGTVAAGQTLLVDSTVSATGSFTNKGTITREGGSGTLDIPAGDKLTNDGTIAVPTGGVTIDGNVSNARSGKIVLGNTSGGDGYGGILTLAGSSTLTNKGTITLAPLATLETTSGDTDTIDNAGGTIDNAGIVTVTTGGTFSEGAGKTTGNPINLISGGALTLTGSGASTFDVQGTISGNIAADQTVNIGRATVTATGSFTNDGTLDTSSSILTLPAGDTLANEGTFNADVTIDGNLTNAASGVIDDYGSIDLDPGSTFDNAGTLDMPYPSGALVLGSPDVPDSDVTFDNTGTMDYGVDTEGAVWGSFGLAPDIDVEGNSTADLGGTIAPLPVGEPETYEAPEPQTITYGIIEGALSPTPTDTVVCSAAVSDGWSLVGADAEGCGADYGAVLEDNEASTLVPTETSVAGSGASNGSGGYTLGYGQAGTVTATVSAQDGSTPTGDVTFYARNQTFDVTGNGLVTVLGTAPLSTSGGVTSASVPVSALSPGQWELYAVYAGDATHLPSAPDGFDVYDWEQIDPDSTSVGLTASPSTSTFGAPVTFTATVTPSPSGPANPTGEVALIDTATGDPIAEAPVSTKKGVTTAKITLSSLLVGDTTLQAVYSGDLNYSGSSSSDVTQDVDPGGAPSTVALTGPSQVAPRATYKATASTDGTAPVWYALATTPAPPAGMTIDSSTGAVKYKVPASGVTSFSYAVVASNAAGSVESAVTTVTVS